MKLVLLLLFSVLCFSEPVDYAKECHYKTLEETEGVECLHVSMSDDYKIHALFPAQVYKNNTTMWIPFVINHKQNATTLTKEVMDKLGIENDRLVLILNGTAFVVTGEENVIGLDFLRSCYIIMNYTKRLVGMVIYDIYSEIHLLNWPMPEENGTREAERMRLTKEYSELVKNYLAEEYKYNELLAPYLQEIEEIKEKIAELKKKDGDDDIIDLEEDSDDDDDKDNKEDSDEPTEKDEEDDD